MVSDFPEAAKAIPLVGSYNQVNFERILAMNPDLIIGWYEGNSAETVEKLSLLKVPVYMSDPKTMDSISRNIRQFGVLTGTEAIADRAAAQYDARRAELQQANANKPPVKVFYQVWEDPLYTLAGGHFITDLYHLCGGVNVFGDLSGWTVAEIGGGYGGLAKVLFEVAHLQHYAIWDIPAGEH